MRIIFLSILIILSQNVFAQNEKTDTSEKVYLIVDEMPRFPGCEVGIMTLEERNQCAEKNMLRFIYSNISYPDSAQIKGTEGKVVLQFVVEKTGRVNDIKMLKDIGDGCGNEALRVVQLMRDENIYWKPGIKDSIAVNVKFTLPITFKLEEYTPPPPYTIFNGDSIYLEVEKPTEFIGGEDALKIFLATSIDYPTSGLDSCLIGDLQSDIMIKKDGSLDLIGTTDFSNLGTDFLFEAIKLIPKMENKWKPATYDGKDVTTIYPMRIEFRPTSEGCKSIVTNYESAASKALQAVTLHDEKKSEEALPIISEALTYFPKNTEWLYFRGIIHMSLQDNESACTDFGEIRNILSIPWYEQWIDLVCKF